MRLRLATALLALLVGATAPATSVALDAALRSCLTSCKTQRRNCRGAFRDQLLTRKPDCRERQPRTAARACIRALRHAFRMNRDACRRASREVCKPCCRAGGTACAVIVCGDGLLSGDEHCDDANTADCDGCTGDCTRADAVCGDTIVECGEECEPPGTPACTAGCGHVVRGPSVVSVSGRELLVRKRGPDGVLALPAPYVIRGVNWSPASKTTATSPADPRNAEVRRAEFGKWFAVDIPLMQAMNVNTVRMYIDPGTDEVLGPLGLAVLDALYHADIMVVMTIDDGINDLARAVEVVRRYKDHPAILMWLLGNEWNINRYFGVAASVPEAAERTETAAATIKLLDAHHPVATSYGDIDIDADGMRLADTARYVNDVVGSVDVWGVNIFRGDSFAGLFTQWAAMTSKPMFLGEFGTDAFETTIMPPRACATDGHLNPEVQAERDLSLWIEVVRNLSARSPTLVAAGGLVFEWNDEWWKVPPSDQQDCGGFAGAHPDGFANEEYFGIVDIDRLPRPVYAVLATAFDPAFDPPH